MVKTTGLNNYSNIHFTNKKIAKKIIKYFNPKSLCLEPCRGNSAFFNYLPKNSDWCEITEGKDFFSYKKPVNWIITNPPFEDLTHWMDHSFCISKNVVFLLPISKVFSSAPRLHLINEYGGIKRILYLGTGRKIGFDIGFRVWGFV